MIIYVKLLGTPYVRVDNIQIYFPFKKAEALFYYILINKTASRDTLINLFWSEFDNSTAKKDLRNAFYSIKKIINCNVFISPKREIITVNPEIHFVCDIFDFMDNNKASLTSYNGDFLEGFNVKNAGGFEEWLLQTREYYRDVYTNSLHKAVICNMLGGNDTIAIEYCKKLINLNDFDEEAYRNLMKIFSKLGKYDKAEIVYNDLSKILKKELSVSPNEKTTELYMCILRKKSLISSSKRSSISFFYKKDKETNMLSTYLNDFLDNTSSKSIIIKGQAGIGKSRFIYEFLNTLEDDKITIFKTQCYQSDVCYFLKPWNSIFEQIYKYISENNIIIPPRFNNITSYFFPFLDLGNCNETEVGTFLQGSSNETNYLAVENALSGILNIISDGKKFILYFDDIQWIDNISLSILKNLILRNDSILFIMNIRNGYNIELDKFITFLKFHDHIHEIELMALTRLETLDFSSNYFKYHDFSEYHKNILYNKTEGNIFFLIELLNSLKNNGKLDELPPKVMDILKTRLFDISEDERKTLNILSIFFDVASLEEIQYVYKGDYLNLLDILSSLVKKNYIKEVKKDCIYYCFTQEMMALFVYSELTESQRVFYHGLIAEMLETALVDDIKDCDLYPKLVYHYDKSDNKIKSLEYKLKNFSTCLQSSHEVFPILCNRDILLNEFTFFSAQQLSKEFAIIRHAIEILKSGDRYKSSEIATIDMQFSYILARDYIRKGNYTKGLKIVFSLIDASIMLNDYKFTLSCYKIIIYYCINACDKTMMKDYIDKAMDIANCYNLKEELSVLLRLKGYSHIMLEEYNMAEKTLNQSIHIFSNIDSKNNFSLNIAAAYNYIGESKRLQKKYYEAIGYYDKAIEVLKAPETILGLPIFYTNAGLCFYKVNDYDHSKKYILTALRLYSKIDCIWQRCTAYCVYALLMIVEDDRASAITNYKKACKYNNMMKNPSDEEILNKLKELLGQ
ncbi:BTAD domain-containing putative transcriptional regulator [Clostridium sp.]|uniref:BTAD domain-containing putative transcriptional regulator n=1 Tax=Clostridium sp. TaxID=1506 RepID=UPI001A446E41|nr:BTAD domain-containing putative transcriptional regulator [Clostridium sp.]MBK5235227.1 AAA family ATPase [Clostridium sp.]